MKHGDLMSVLGLADPPWRVGRKFGRTLYIGDTYVGMMETPALASDVANAMNVRDAAPKSEAPIPMIISCPACGARHIDEGEFATKAHHTHACQTCGVCWRPAIVATCGVRFLPGFKNEEQK